MRAAARLHRHLARPKFRQGINRLSRVTRRRRTTAPQSSSPTTLTLFLPRSTPTIEIVIPPSSQKATLSRITQVRGGPFHNHRLRRLCTPDMPPMRPTRPFRGARFAADAASHAFRSCRGACRSHPAPATPERRRKPGSPAQRPQHAAQGCRADIPPTRTVVPSGSATSIVVSRPEPCWREAAAGAAVMAGAGCSGTIRTGRNAAASRRAKGAGPHLPTPIPQQAAADLMPPGNRRETGPGHLRLGHDPQLLLQPPAATALNPGDDLHHSTRSRP